MAFPLKVYNDSGLKAWENRAVPLESCRMFSRIIFFVDTTHPGGLVLWYFPGRPAMIQDSRI